MTRNVVSRLAGLVLLSVVSLFAAACTSGAGDAEAERPKVGLVQINQQAIFFNEMNKGAEQAAEEAGVDLEVFNANDDAARQAEAIANFATQGFDAIIVVAIDVEGIKPAIQAAKEQGIRIVAVDAIVDDPAVDVQVGVDNAAAGKEIGEYVGNYIKDNGLAAKVGVVGALNSFIQNQRKDSFADAVKASDVSITQVVDGQNRQEAALTAAENLVTSQRDTQVIYATGEPALLGAVAAMRSQNKTNDVEVFGWDLTREAIAGIDDGFVVGVVQQDPRTEGAEAVKAAKTLIEGGSVEKNINVAVTIVTKENVDEYRATFQ